MKHMKVDGRSLMLNEAENRYWADTSNYKRMPEHDDADVMYCKLRDEMIRNGDEDFYKACLPPATVAGYPW